MVHTKIKEKTHLLAFALMEHKKIIDYINIINYVKTKLLKLAKTPKVEAKKLGQYHKNQGVEPECDFHV